MIARHDTHTEKADIWSRLAEPLPNGVVYWRQDGKVIGRDGRYFARFVAYIEANTARERLDAVVPGEWDLTLELLPPIPGLDEGGESAPCSFKARLQILGVIREDVGTGRDYKAAATDAFKRAAVRFGIAHELYAYEQNWVQMDGDGRNAKPLEDPGVVYARRFGPTNGAPPIDDESRPTNAESSDATSTPARARNGVAKRVRSTAAATAHEVSEPPEEVTAAADPVSTPSCPKCDGRMWDNRLTKRNPKAPDFKCRDRSCDGVIWPPRAGEAATPNESSTSAPAESRASSDSLDTSPLGMSLDDLPF